MSLRTLVLATLAAFAAGGTGPAPRVSASAPPGFDDVFSAKTMRVDYFHTGSGGRETVALDRVVSDGPWPGSRTRLVDDTNLGKYLFEVIDRATNRVSTRAASRRSTESGRRPTRPGRACTGRSTSRCGFRGRSAGAGRPEEARPRERLPRGLVDA